MGSVKGGSRSCPISCYPQRRECGVRRIQPDCAPSGFRTVQRPVPGLARKRAEAREGMFGFVASTKSCRCVERVFARMKIHDDPYRVRLRGLRGAGGRFLLAATARNLKRMGRMGAEGTTPKGGDRGLSQSG